jgi:hypothetical protein
MFDGFRFSVKDGSKTIVSTATRALILGANGSTSTLSGESVSRRDTPSGFEMTVNGQREIHRNDGSIRMTEQGSTRQFFDGNNQIPILEQRNGETFIVAPGGERVGMKPRGSLRGYGDAAEWGTQIARTLKTPEAIGAFISQFFHGQDYEFGSEKNERNQQIQKPQASIQYQHEGRGQQDVKHWQRTLIERSGDCEDFALLANGLLKQAGIKSFTMLVTPEHYESVYFEPAGTDSSGRDVLRMYGWTTGFQTLQSCLCKSRRSREVTLKSSQKWRVFWYVICTEGRTRWCHYS